MQQQQNFNSYQQPHGQGLSPTGRQQYQHSTSNSSTTQLQAPVGLFSAQNSLNHLKLLRQQQFQQAQKTQQQNPSARLIEQRKNQMQLASGNKEFCARHKDEPNVGFCEASGDIVCNLCIFDKKLQAVKYTALVSKDLRTEFNAVFSQYKNGLNAVSGVDANLVKQRAAILMQKFFTQVREKVKLLKQQTMTKIQQSESLRELEKIIQESKEFMPNQSRADDDHFDREKRLFDEKVSKGRYAYLVKHEDFYHDIINSLDQSSVKIRHSVERSHEQMDRVLQLKADDMKVRTKLNQIVTECLQVDMQSVLSSHLSPEERKSALPNSTQSNGYQIQFSPRNSEVGVSNFAHASSNINSSMLRNSVPNLNSNFKQISTAQQVQADSGTNFTFGRQQSSSPSPRPTSSPVPQHVCFSPITTPQQQAMSAVATNRESQPSVAGIDNEQSRLSPSNSNQTMVQVKRDENHQVAQNQSQIKLEHSFKSTFKLKGQALLKLIPSRGWVKIKDLQNLLLSKTVQTQDEAAYVVGGARDRDSKQTISEVHMFQVRNGAIHSDRKADMNQSRSSHGCTINLHTNQIYVAGGYHLGELTRTCEVYSVQTNTWMQLPPLNEAKCSNTLCTLNGCYLYCLGGLSKSDEGKTGFLLASVEVLDLEATAAKWLMLSIKLPQQMCDIGAVPINNTDILLYGGWNKSPQVSTFIVRQSLTQDMGLLHSLQQVNGQMEKGDFAMISGVAMKTQDPDVIKVCCHTHLFSFNLKANCFTGTSTS